MNDVLFIDRDQIVLFLLAFVRVTAMISLLPVFGSGNIPPLLKAGFALCLTVVVYPLCSLHGAVALPATLLEFIGMLALEIGVGILIGFVGTFLFTAVQFAGRLIDQQIGFAFVQVVDPFSNSAVTTTGQLKILIFTIVFLLINGHYFMLIAVQKSFELIPLLGARMPGGKFAFIVTEAAGAIFETGLRLAAPVYITLVLTSLALGLVARTVPQLNVFFVGLPLKIGLGIGVLVIVLPGLVHVFRSMVDGLVQTMWRLLYLMA